MNWIDELINNYFSFLKEKTIVTKLENSDWIEISTPFTDVFNDTIEIYAKRNNGKIFLTDDGITMRNLELSGVEISRSAKRKDYLEKILLNHGVKLDNSNELTSEATVYNFPQKKLNLISAISEANDLFVLARHRVSEIFWEDVKKYLDKNDIIYTPYFISKGSTGLEFTFDFQIAYKNEEILIKAFNTINKLNLPHFLFTWDDVRQVRERQTSKSVKGLAVVNDTDREIKAEYIEALKNKKAETILWSERDKEENISKLKAA